MNNAAALPVGERRGVAGAVRSALQSRGPEGTHTRISPVGIMNALQVVLKSAQSFCEVQRRKHWASRTLPVKLTHSTDCRGAPGTKPGQLLAAPVGQPMVQLLPRDLPDTCAIEGMQLVPPPHTSPAAVSHFW